MDLDRLERTRRWGDVPPAERSDEWVREFEAAFWPAPLVAPVDRVLVGGRDGRPYQVVTFPDDEPRLPGLEPRHARPASIVDELIEKGHGLWFGIEGNEPLCVFTLGEILSYRLYGRAFAMLPPPQGDGDVFVSRGETLQLWPTNEWNLPEGVRVNLRRHLQTAFGVERPRACWVRFPDGKEGIALDLASVHSLDETSFRRAFDAIRWLLPMRLLYFRLDTLADQEAMQPF